jgi:surface polysaccharide O-acyltransferase-like enzyme
MYYLHNSSHSEAFLIFMRGAYMVGGWISKSNNMIGWISRNLLLPLSPFVVGALIRTLQNGSLSLDVLDPGELSFSMAIMLCMVSISAGRLNNEQLRDSLTNMYLVGVIVFLVLFTLSIFLQSDIEKCLKEILSVASASARDSIPVSTSSIPPRIIYFSDFLSRIRIATIGLSLFIAPITIWSATKYNLEDL